jgi:hypothetical protein
MQMAGAAGASGSAFLAPLVIGIGLITFALALLMSMAPNESEIRDDAEFNSRIDKLQRRAYR